MHLTYSNPPAGIRELAYRALNMEILRHPHEGHPHGLRERSNAFGHIPDFQKVFLFTPKASAGGKNLSAAKQIAWYDVVVLSGISHGIEVAQRQDGHASTHVTRGADVDRQIAVLTALAHDGSSGDVAEVRVLRVPSIAIFSFWLYFRTRKRSRIVPVLSSATQLHSGKSYSPEEFLEAIRATAGRLISQAPRHSPRKLISTAVAAPDL
jgi:hypothetical protein